MKPIVQLSVPDDVADELAQAGIATAGGVVERRSVESVGDVVAQVAHVVLGTGGLVVTLVNEGPEAWRRIADVFARWGRWRGGGERATVTVLARGKRLTLDVAGDSVDVEAIARFLVDALGGAEDDV